MGANDIAEWVRGRLKDFLPDWLDPIPTALPDGVLLLVAPLIIFIVIGLVLYAIFEIYQKSKKGYQYGGRGLQGKPIEGPAPATQDDFEKLRADIFKALAPSPDTAPMDAEAEAAKHDAVADLAADATPDAMEAVYDFTKGDVQVGFDILERQARSAEVQAAEKWRRLGALANGVDTTRARRAYEQAFRLQPDDFFTCVMLTRLRMKAGDLNAATEAAAAAVPVAASNREKFIADSQYGDVLVAAGDLEGARSRYEEVLKIAARLAENNPGSAEAQRDVSISLDRLGDVLVKAGDLEDARSRFEESLKITERLAENNQGNAEAQRDVLVSLGGHGDVLVKAGDLTGARLRFEEVLRVAERLAEDNPGSAEAQRDVSVSLERLGDVLVEAGDLTSARSRYEESLKIRERLAEDNPGSAEAQRDVWVSLIKLGDVLVKVGDLEAARPRFEEVFRVAEGFAEDNPGSAEAQRDMSVSLERLGNVLVAAGDLEGARSHFEGGLKIREHLAENNPGSAEAQRDLMISYFKLGAIFSGQGWFAKGLAICEKLVSEGRLAPADGWLLDDLRQRAAADDD